MWKNVLKSQRLKLKNVKNWKQGFQGPFQDQGMHVLGGEGVWGEGRAGQTIEDLLRLGQRVGEGGGWGKDWKGVASLAAKSPPLCSTAYMKCNVM